MTPTQVKEAYTLMVERDTLKSRIEKVRAWGPKVNVYLGTPSTNYDAYAYAGPRNPYVENFPIASQSIIDVLERELTDVANKLKGLGVTD